MKIFSCYFLVLCLFVALSTQCESNNCCGGASPLTILPFPHTGLITTSSITLDVDVDLELLGIDINLDIDLDLGLNLGGSNGGRSITAGAWYIIDHSVPLALNLDICALNNVAVSAYLFRGSCNNLQRVNNWDNCCGVDIDIDVVVGETYYLFVVTEIEVDLTIDLDIISYESNTHCNNPLEILEPITIGSTLGLLDLDVSEIWYFIYSGSNRAISFSNADDSDIDVTISVYIGGCDSLELVASIDTSIVDDILSIDLDLNTIYYVVVSSNGQYGQFNLHASIISSILPDITVDVELGESGIICSEYDNLLTVTGTGIHGLTYELIVANLHPIIIDIDINGLFTQVVDISDLIEGEFIIQLIESGTGRSCEKRGLVNQLLSEVASLLDDLLGSSGIVFGDSGLLGESGPVDNLLSGITGLFGGCKTCN